MALTTAEKAELISQFGKNDKDTGSSESQIAILSKRIEQISEHLKTNKKDNHSRRGLITLVNTRRKLLDYLKKKEFDRYKSVIEALGIRK